MTDCPFSWHLIYKHHRLTFLSAQETSNDTNPRQPQRHFREKSFAHVATSHNDIPQVTPVWVEYDGEHILVNSAKGRKKDRNLRAHPEVAISVQDPDNPYRYVGLQGKVVEITEEGGTEHIHKLSRKYNGRDYPESALAGPPRVIYKIAPTRVWTMG